jgi:hypothetical protein
MAPLTQSQRVALVSMPSPRKRGEGTVTATREYAIAALAEEGATATLREGRIKAQ